jgi:Flp pilus assembly pilin Flp
MRDSSGTGQRERGATAVEYSLIVVLIAAVVVTAVAAVGQLTLDLWGSLGPF